MSREKQNLVTYDRIHLTGDYDPLHERQDQASARECICVVEFHFNTAGPDAVGGEVWYQPGSDASQEFAEVMWAQISAIPLPAHGNNAVRPATSPARAAYIRHYEMPTILLEPLFVSNPNDETQGPWLHGLHGDAHLNTLADAITAAIKGQFPGGGKIGLSRGHWDKTSSPNDRGGNCYFGSETHREGDHIAALFELVWQKLE